MSAMSNYLENKLVDLILRGQAFSAPANVYVGLFTTDPTDAGGGTEVSGGSYARVALSGALASWAGTQSAGSTSASSGTGGVTSNNAAITWAAAPTANWGTVTHFGIFDAATTGNLLIHGALTASKTINNGDPAPAFPAGSLVVTFA